MSRTFNDPLEHQELHRRQQRPHGSNSNYAPRDSPRSFSNQASYPNQNRASPGQDREDSAKGDNQLRRRIGLACSRCRKRKIKCSGDVAGQGCQNCKNAGAESCNFLRVNSTDTILAPNSAALDWPYSNSGPVSLTGGVGRVHNTMGAFPNVSGIVPNVSTYAISQPYRTPSVNHHQYPQIPSRHPHPAVSAGYGLGFNDEAFENYNTQSPQYMLPTQENQSQLAAYATPDLSRHWTPITANNRAPIGGLGFENDPSSRYGNSNFPYLNSSATASIAPDGSPFPGMNALARDLPRHGDRRLPNPARKSSAERSTSFYQSKSGESVPHGLPSGLSHKSSVAWRPESMTQATTHGSVSSTSLSTVSSTGPLSSTSSVSPAETQPQSNAFGYIHLPHSPTQGSAPQVSDVGSTNISTGQPASLTDLSFSAGHNFFPSSNSALHYDYTTGGMRGPVIHENLSSAGTLVSGARYQEPNYPPVLQRRPSQPLETESPPTNPPIQGTPITTTSTSHRRC